MVDQKRSAPPLGKPDVTFMRKCTFLVDLVLRTKPSISLTVLAPLYLLTS